MTVSTPYQDVAVTVAEEPNAAELRAIAVIGPPDLVAHLLNTTSQRTALVEYLAGGEAWGSLRFLPSAESVDGIHSYTPDYEPLTGPDAWQPEYELAAPLCAPDGELIGMLSMDRPRDGRIPPAWVNDVLELFAEQAAIAILNAHRHEQALRAMQTLEREKAELHSAFAEQCARETHLRNEARCDPLTGLANRVLLQERLQELLAAQTPVTVVFCDLDHFKQINRVCRKASSAGDLLRGPGPRAGPARASARAGAAGGGAVEPRGPGNVRAQALAGRDEPAADACGAAEAGGVARFLERIGPSSTVTWATGRTRVSSPPRRQRHVQPGTGQGCRTVRSAPEECGLCRGRSGRGRMGSPAPATFARRPRDR